jgi:PAS domain S-box-containing protein
MAELKNRLASLPPNTVILYLSFFLDPAGNSYSGPEALSLFAPTSSVPTYGISETYMGVGIVGGSLIDFEALGKRTGQIALRVLAGERVSDIHPESVPNVQVFDWRQLKRWGIDDRRVPAASTVRFKSPTFWELYKWYVLAIIAVLIIESSLIAWLLFTRRRRHQAEASVLRSEERFSKAFRSNPQPMSLTTIDEGRYLDVNDSFLAVSGYTRDEVVGHTSLELGIWDTSASRIDFVEQLKEHGSVLNAETRFRSKDGSVRLLLTSAEQIEIAGEHCLLSASTDITERKKAEEALLESRSRLLLAQQAAHFGTFDWNIKTGVNTWSAELESMYGLEPGSFAGSQSAWEDLVHPDDREMAIASVRRALESGVPVEDEWRVQWPDGSIHWLFGRFQVLTDDSGRPLHLTGINIDITSRKLMEGSLRESEARFRNLADTAPVLIWMSGPDRLCTYFNQQWLDFTGRTIDQELGDGWADGVYRDDYQRCLEIYTNSFDSRKKFEMEYRLRRADGEYRWIVDIGIPRFLSTGEFGGYIGSCVDITDRKNALEALREAHEQLRKLKDQLEAENIYLQEELKGAPAFGDIVGGSDALKEVLNNINVVAPTGATVLITGETGTGKELVARAIHSASSRRDRPLIRVNCGALPASLIETELFGHEKGAFTGAGSQKAGRFELANGGTIFLDEIGELSLESQVKLLRVLQEGEFERVGGTKTVRVDVRIIAATNRNLKAAVESGTFREDLWYRLNVFPISVPPLRQRREDIPLLTEHFVRKFSLQFGKNITRIAPATIKALREYSWRGNVRELANVLERAVINTNGSVLRLRERLNLVEPVKPETKRSSATLTEVERDYIVGLLEDCGWRVEGPNGAARILGLNASTLRSKMSKLGIKRIPNNKGPG